VPNERYRLANPFQVPLKGKNKTLVKILGGHDPCNSCGVDAYTTINVKLQGGPKNGATG